MGSSTPSGPSRGARLSAASALLCAGLLPRAAGAGDGGVTFVSPSPGAVIAEGPVVIAGRLPAGTGEISLLLNGRPLGGAVTRGNTFSVSFTPPRGFSEVEVRARGESGKLAFAFRTLAPGQSRYAYHRPLQEGKCDPCHRRGPAAESLTEAAVCYGCHEARAVMFPFVHGPVAAGSCLVCHDPHGSSLPGLCRLPPGETCLSCHDQPSSAKHTSSRTRVCTICHHPHYAMNRRLLRDPF